MNLMPYGAAGRYSDLSREVDEHFGTMVCFHPRYALGDHHNHMDKDDFLREMYLDTVGHDEAGMKRYERMVNIVSSRFRHGPKTEERAIDEAMQKVISEKYLMLPLYLYDHSGLAMSTEVSQAGLLMQNGTADRSAGSMFPKKMPKGI
mgnify:CR=1 FL=1